MTNAAIAPITEQHVNEYRRYQAAMECVYNLPGDPPPLTFDEWFLRCTGRAPAFAYSED